jgi:hypothetical protein
MLACGSPADEVGQDQCLEYGTTCEWDYNTCFTTAVALAKGAFGANDSSAAVAVATKCAVAQSAAACVAAGGALTLSSSLVAAVAAGNFTIRVPPATSPSENDTMSDNSLGTGSNVTVLPRSRGGAGAPRAAAGATLLAAAAAVLLLGV